MTTTHSFEPQCQSTPNHHQTATVVLQVNPVLAEAATIIGAQRTAAHDRAGRKPGACLGAEGNVRADYLGVLAELVVVDGLERCGLHPQGYALLTETPTPHGDFRLNGLTYDVKVARAPQRWIYVNEE